MEVVSRIERVTVYASGARVRRVIALTEPVPPRVRIAALPLAVIDDTVRCEVTGSAIVAQVRAGLDAAAAPVADEEGAELRAARRRLAIADAEAARLTAATDALAGAEVAVADPSDEPP